MTLDEIMEEWSVDSKIDSTDLGDESLKTPSLHSKYIRMLSSERLLLRKLEFALKSLRHDKYEFYTMGPTEDTQRLGWKLPPKGVILKSEANGYVDSDRDVVEATLKVAYQLEKVDFLIDCLKMIHNRQWSIRGAIDWAKFQSGG